MIELADAVIIQPQSAQANATPHPIVETPFNPSWGYDLNLLSHAASTVALEGDINHRKTHHQQRQQRQQQQNDVGAIPQQAPAERSIIDSYGVEPSILDMTADMGDPVQDFSVFLESVGLSSDWDSGFFSVDDPAALPPPPPPMPIDSSRAQSRAEVGRIGDSTTTNTTNTTTTTIAQEEPPSFSNFGYRLPSLQPDEVDDRIGLQSDENSRPAWDISNADRQIFLSRLEEFSYVLPRDFVPPSRHALSRFIAGYINGLNEHLPFIHVPTLSIARSSPELILALAAAGSHYRFEHSRGFELFHASKSVLLERLRRRDGGQASYATWNNFMPPSSGDFHTSSGSSITSMATPDSPFPGHQHMRAEDPTTGYWMDESEAQMEVIRTFLLLTVFASWERHPDLLREILSLQSTLARLVREHGLSESSAIPETISWDEWIRQEGNRRTKFIVYCFFNLHSIMYNIPPLILNAELRLNMPCSHDVWKATSAMQWRRLYQMRYGSQIPFQEAFAKLFTKSEMVPSVSAPISPLGNYILIHALIQQIFFARQLCLCVPNMQGSGLRQEDLNVLDNSLTAWKALWKRTPESSIDPQNPAGPIAFTSTALLGLAYIRLHVDLGPCRHLISQDPVQIARALNDSPPFERNPRLIMALLHSAHALSIPVRLGIDFVARTHSFFWSIQHSLCSLECAFLLSRWLLSIPSSSQSLSEHERKLLLWLRSMMDETDGYVVDAPGGAPDLEFVSNPDKARQLSVAIIRVWARTFKGNTSWAIVDLVGLSLDAYADLLEGVMG